ncbi:MULTISPECIES: hypothetical protein [Paenibacillus]|uniref:Lipoprotein n=1 Tax=Paenibacillus odorifer TaxID=189426 RepID=A0A1R0WWU6_9BACL|nr:hypothetical protein [Paenibacillus odorifer]OMD23313.1 hypothetical protein BJP51_30290 [Paenibacillus odorifer]
MKKMMLSILLIVSLIGISGCAESNIGDLKISAGDQEIKSTTLSNTKSDSSSNAEASGFEFSFEQDAVKNIQYLKNGEIITLDFGDSEPDNVSLEDSVLNKSGAYQFSSRETLEVPITKKDGKYSFTIEKHMASSLSSFYEENKKDYRGFSITASWGEKEYRYAFVIQADAN